MLKKIAKVWGLILAIMLIASMLIPAAPAQALYGQEQWQAQSLPSTTGSTLLSGSDVSDIAIGPGVIYAINGAAAGAIYKSTDGAASFAKTVVPKGAAGLTAISVAPDNANVIAVTDGTTVYTSSDAGSTWSALPALAGVWAGNAILDIAVAPARSGTLLGREYVIAVANVAATTVTGGDVLIIGGDAAWASVVSTTTANITSTRDYMAVAVTPNFVGDRSIVAVGAAVTAGTGTPTANGVVCQVINTATKTVASTAYLYSTAGATTDFSAAPGTSIARASIALPSDFDATTSSGRRAYVGITSQTAQVDNDVYRADDTASKALSAVTTQGVYSVTYAGTISTGTLLEARASTAEVKYSTDMTGGSPTWTASKKLMPTNTTNNIVVVAADFATTKKVYAATSGAGAGDQSALSISKDGGISFNQMALVDNGNAGNALGTISSFSVSSDAKNVFLASVNGTVMELWTSPTPTADSTWTRIFVGTGTAPKLSFPGDYATTSTFYLYNQVTGGKIYRTTDNGATWNERLLPSSDLAIATGGLTWVDSNVGYLVAGTNLYKTTNGAWTWGGAVQFNTNGFRSITTGKTDQVLVGGTGIIANSVDGGATFTQISLDAGVSYRILKDTGFKTNNLLWLADATATTGAVFKFTLGTDAKPTNVLAPHAGTAISGVAIKSGILYVNFGSRGIVDRTVNPYDTPGTIAWDTIGDYPANTATSVLPAGGSFAVLTSTDPTTKDTLLYAYNAAAGGASTGTTGVWVYTDQMATAKPVISSPKDNISLSVDPVTGRADTLSLVLKAVGSGTALATYYQVEVTEKAVGWAGAAQSGSIKVSQPNAPQINVGKDQTSGFNTILSANKVYQVRVRAVDQVAGDAINSIWSDPLTVNVASGGIVSQTQYGPVLLGPQPGAVNVSTSPVFSWAPQFGANKYKFTLATDAALTKPVAGTPKEVTSPSFQVTTALTNNTGYFWAVQVIDPAPGPVSIGTFTTAPKAAPATAAPAPIITMPPITIPPIVIPKQPAPTFTIPPAPPAPTPATPAYIWATIIIGAILVIAVIVLIVRTRKTP